MYCLSLNCHGICTHIPPSSSATLRFYLLRLAMTKAWWLYEVVINSAKRWHAWTGRAKLQRKMIIWTRHFNLTIIELTVCLDVCSCGNRHLQRLMSPSPKSQVNFASAFSWIGDFFFSDFCHSYFLIYAQFVEYVNMHAAGCWLDKTVWVSPLYLIEDGRLCMQWIEEAGLCGRIRLCPHGVTTVGGVTAGYARHK